MEMYTHAQDRYLLNSEKGCREGKVKVVEEGSEKEKSEKLRKK